LDNLTHTLIGFIAGESVARTTRAREPLHVWDFPASWNGFLEQLWGVSVLANQKRVVLRAVLLMIGWRGSPRTAAIAAVGNLWRPVPSQPPEPYCQAY
jgi:hypothetical protein